MTVPSGGGGGGAPTVLLFFLLLLFFAVAFFLPEGHNVLPDSDGLDVLLRLKKEKSNVKIISMSGGSKTLGQSDVFLNLAKDFGSHHAIKKPFSNDELLSVIKSLLPD